MRKKKRKKAITVSGQSSVPNRGACGAGAAGERAVLCGMVMLRNSHLRHALYKTRQQKYNNKKKVLHLLLYCI